MLCSTLFCCQRPYAPSRLQLEALVCLHNDEDEFILMSLPTVYPVQLDTGSSDLFIRGDSSPLSGVQNTVSIVNDPPSPHTDSSVGCLTQSLCE